MASFSLKYPKVAHIGKKVSHSKQRSSRPFKRNLHTVTIIDPDTGEKKRLKVPTKVLRQLKKAGITTHYQNQKTDE